jgi:hypothetical protein
VGFETAAFRRFDDEPMDWGKCLSYTAIKLLGLLRISFNVGTLIRRINPSAQES